MPSPSVKLDRERTLRYDFGAFIALDETCGVNVYALDLRKLSPTQLRDLVWAGQLHTDKALTREQVAKYLPTNMQESVALTGEVLKAIAASYGADDSEPPKA